MVSVISGSMGLAMVPIIIQIKYQAEYLRYFGFYYHESGLMTTWICLHVLFVFVFGIFSILGTETAFTIVSYHASGLMKISGYVRNHFYELLSSTIETPIHDEDSRFDRCLYFQLQGENHD